MTAWNPAWPLTTDATDTHRISGELSTERLTGKCRVERVTARVPIEFGAGLRQRGAAGVSVHVMNLSTHGFRVETHLDLCEGQEIWLRLPGLESSLARVCWVQGYSAGCAFDHPLHPAVLDLIVARNKAR